MIEYRKGCDLLTSGATYVVIPVNCVGTCGAGLALAAKRRWPRWARDYAGYCQARALRPGDVLVHQPEVIPGQGVVSFATKDHWRDPTQLEWVGRGLETLVGLMKQMLPASIALPALGCGNGGLAWIDVQPFVHAAAKKMADAGVRVWIYEPHRQR